MGIRCTVPLAFVLLTACATAPEIEEEARPAVDSRIKALQDGVADGLAANPGGAPKGLTITIPSVEEAGTQVIFEAHFDVPATFAKTAQDFTVYVSCEATDIAACTRKTLDAAQALTRMKAEGP
jgi:hypothetical protein